MRKKAFVFSLSTLLVFITVVWFAAFYSEKVEREEQSILDTYPIEKAGFVADDLAFDFNFILGTSQEVHNDGNLLRVKLSDKLPADINKMQLLDLNGFVDSNYAGMQNASLSLGLERLLDGKTEMFFNNGLQYDYAYGPDQNYVHFKGNMVEAGVSSYDINVFVRGARLDTATAWSCGTTGSVTVSLRYADSYGESKQSLNCEQNPSGTYTYTFTFQEIGGSLVVSFGSVDGNSNSVKVRNGIESTGSSVYASIEASMASPSDELFWYYDADLNYAQGSVELDRKIELGRA